MYIIKEAIYGNMATVFHRTSVSDLVNRIFDSGFKPGSGDMYGSGFYSTYELKSQLGSKMINTYGNIIVKFACPISTFFIFDYEEFMKSSNFKKLGSPQKSEFLEKQFEFFKMDYSKFNFDKKVSFTSEQALWCSKNIPNFQKLCEGIVFTGSRDGKVLVSYNTKLIVPLSYTVDDGKTWEKVELNLNYLKKVAKVKSNFVPDLSVKPEEFGIIDYEFDSNGFLNVRHSVELNNKNLKTLPFKFGKIGGNFNCDYNNLTSLEGAPQKVGEGFYCNSNNLTSLEGAPKEVGDFYCDRNNLTSLEGAPQKVGGNFGCHRNNLTSLEGAPKEVGGNFYCNSNNLTSLKGAPKEVGGDFGCDKNNLTSLKGAPKEVGGDFLCYRNQTKFTVKDVEKVCKVSGKIFID